MPTRGAPGLAARNSASTCSSTRTSRSVPYRRHGRFGVVLRIGSQVKKCSPSDGSCTPFTQPAGVRPPDRGRSPPLDRLGEHALGRLVSRLGRDGRLRADGCGRPDGRQQEQRQQRDRQAHAIAYAAVGAFVSSCIAFR